MFSLVLWLICLLFHMLLNVAINPFDVANLLFYLFYAVVIPCRQVSQLLFPFQLFDLLLLFHFSFSPSEHNNCLCLSIFFSCSSCPTSNIIYQSYIVL